MNRKNTNSIIIELLKEKPVAFNPALARLVKSATAGLLMSQLLYWWDKGCKKGCIFKTITEFEKETCLTRSEQDTAIRKWKKLGVLRVENHGVPRKRHFYLNTEKLIKFLEDEAEKKDIKGYYIKR